MPGSGASKLAVLSGKVQNGLVYFGLFARALRQALRQVGARPVPWVVVAAAVGVALKDFQVEKLSGVALQYQFVKFVQEFEVIGPETGPFAFYFEEMGALCIVGGNKKNIEYLDFYGDNGDAVLSLCKKEGTSLQVVNGRVVCSVGTTTVVGDSYQEALMRAYVARHRKSEK